MSISRTLVAALVALLGCAHSTKSTWNPAERQLCNSRLCYQVGPLDESWKLIAIKDGSLTFSNPALGAVIQSAVTCKETVTDAAPLSALMRHLLIGYTDRTVRSSEDEMLAGRAGFHQILDVHLDGVPIVLDLHVIRRDGCIFDLALAVPPNHYEKGAPAFVRFVAEFGSRSQS